MGAIPTPLRSSRQSTHHLDASSGDQTAELKEEGEEDPKDDARGWWGTVMEDNVLSSHAPLMILLRLPSAGHNLRNKKMPAAESVDEIMPVQQVYVKTFPSAVTVKARLKALDKHVTLTGESHWE